MHHGSWDAERSVTFIPNTVHILDWVTRKGTDKDTGGVGFGHVLYLEEKYDGIKLCCSYYNDYKLFSAKTQRNQI